MNTQQIQEELKRHEEACAELRAKLEASKAPKCGDCFSPHLHPDLIFILVNGGFINASDFTTFHKMDSVLTPDSIFTKGNYTYRGTFDDNFIRREAVGEEYIKKSDLADVLANASNEDLEGPDTRICIRDRFNLIY